MWTLFNNDWYIVWANNAPWEIDKGIDTISKTSVYEIFYSPYRNKYKFKCSGYKPKQHNCYNDVIKILNKFINEQKETAQQV